MCGIAGHIGNSGSGRITVRALETIQHRGKDSTGLAVMTYDGNIIYRKAVGTVNRFKKLHNNNIPSGKIAIGHVRMATHGDVTPNNAHPLTDCTGDIAVVHNGVIKNWESLRNQLEAIGHVFKGETDSEVIPHLIEEYYEGNLSNAVEAVMTELEGSATFLAIHKNHPDRIVGATNGYGLSATVSDIGTTIASEQQGTIAARKNGEPKYYQSGTLMTCFEHKILTRRIKINRPEPEYDYFNREEWIKRFFKEEPAGRINDIYGFDDYTVLFD